MRLNISGKWKKGLGVCLLASSVLASAPVMAGFEWMPQTQDMSRVPVITSSEDRPAQPTSRRAVVPSQQETKQPETEPLVVMPQALPPLAEKEPAPVTNAPAIRRSVQQPRTMRVIDRTQSAVQKPSDTMFTPMPGAAYDSVKPAAPAVQASSGYVQSAEEKRPLREPVPLVLENMEKMDQSQAVSQYQRRQNPAMKNDAFVPVPSVSSVSSVAVSAPKSSPRGPIVINPYPTQNNAVSAPSSVASVSPVEQSAVSSGAAKSLSSFDAVSGFGSGVPLIMGLQQVIPSDYTYSFSANVDLSRPVSWQGDRPWPVVLQDMLEAQGYSVAIGENSVVIR